MGGAAVVAVHFGSDSQGTGYSGTHNGKRGASSPSRAGSATGLVVAHTGPVDEIHRKIPRGDAPGRRRPRTF